MTAIPGTTHTRSRCGTVSLRKHRQAVSSTLISRTLSESERFRRVFHRGDCERQREVILLRTVA